MVARRSHQKSRKGCQNCKRRRVKCDETHPECTPCRKHEIECDYLTSSNPATPALETPDSPVASSGVWEVYGTPSISDTTLDPFVFTDANGSEEGSSRGESPVFIVSSPGAASSGSGTRASSPAYRSIRRHKKSRNGCRNCKKRRIKCNEDYPTCGQCGKHGIECDYMEMFRKGLDAPNTAKTPAPASQDSVMSRSRDEVLSCSSPEFGYSDALRPALMDSDVLMRNTPQASYSTESTELVILRRGEMQQNILLPTFLELAPKCSTEDLDLSTADFQLLHQYTSETYNSLSLNRADIKNIFAKIVPQIAFSNPFLFHTILACGGEHLYRKTGSVDIRLRAGHHMELALQKYRAELSNITPICTEGDPSDPEHPCHSMNELISASSVAVEKAQALFLTSCLVSVMAFISASGCSSPASMFSPPHSATQPYTRAVHDEVLSWLINTLSVTRGTRILVETYWPSLRFSSISALFTIHEKIPSDPEPFLPLFRRIERLFWLCSDNPPAEPPSYFPIVVLDPKTPSSRTPRIPSAPLAKPPPPPPNSPYYDLYDAISILYDHAHHGVPNGNVPWIFAWPVIVNSGYFDRLRQGHWRERVVVCWYLGVLNALEVDLWWIGSTDNRMSVLTVLKEGLEKEGLGVWCRGIEGDLVEVFDG